MDNNGESGLSDKPYITIESCPPPCPICNEKPGQKKDWYEHIKVHITPTGQKEGLICSYCPAFFVIESKRTIHEMEQHGKKTPFPCRGCEKDYTSQSNLNQHKCEKKNQSGKKLFECHTCGKKPVQNKDLQAHQEVHITFTGKEGDLICSYCSAPFVKKCGLRNHEREQHGETTPFQCTDCKKYYTTEYNLEKHESKCREKSQSGRPTRWKCSLCKQYYYDEAEFDNHKCEGITFEEEHSYSSCEEDFANEFVLNSHECEEKSQSCRPTLGQLIEQNKFFFRR